MSESLSDSGWNIVNSFAHARQDREKPLPQSPLPEVPELSEEEEAPAALLTDEPKERGLYDNLTIRDRTQSKAQSRIIGGIANRRRY